MRILACFFLLAQIVTVTAFAASYSCRDSEGRLYITDNLQALPEECRAAVKEVPPDDPDNLNFVPQQTVPKDVKSKFQQQVRETEEGIKLKKIQADDYIRRAKQAAEQYQQAIAEKRKARNRWSYKSRGIIRNANKRIDEARATKKQLLDEIGDQRLRREQERQILAELEKISEP